MPEFHLSIDIQSPPEVVFDLLADIAHYSRWLPPSGTYRETGTVSESPVRLGTTYHDHNNAGEMLGEVTEYQPPTRLGFREATQKPGLVITIVYRLSPLGDGTHVERTSTLVTAGIIRLAQPLVVATTRRENQRTLNALKAYLESPSAE